MPDYKITVCPSCREQLDPEYESSHEHSGVRYYGREVVVHLDEQHWELDDARHEDEQAQRDRDRADRERRRELHELETQWRMDAPREQVEAYEESQRRHERSMSGFSEILRSEFGELQRDLNRQSYLLLGRNLSDEELEERAREQHAHDVDRNYDTIALFRLHGPTRVSFWKLRQCRNWLDERGYDPDVTWVPSTQGVPERGGPVRFFPASGG